ncbi:hypothetical protein PGTUg99_002717 [Puccinia graminis f. sp. tritici]|uniref:Uncharacterized protein n=1 Tax=Puccinia graminis f. sp. tritici TaxID=56615 RepID=A0A5B0S0S7_PUCGR|nr:hypothetical protein PGTUg99_002717 [Puccinia graminis f. sp. tritici]
MIDSMEAEGATGYPFPPPSKPHNVWCGGATHEQPGSVGRVQFSVCVHSYFEPAATSNDKLYFGCGPKFPVGLCACKVNNQNNLYVSEPPSQRHCLTRHTKGFKILTTVCPNHT